MYKIHQQRKARRDLKDIWFYSYENFGVVQADKYFDELESAMETIKDNPLIGISCDYIRKGYRQYKEWLGEKSAGHAGKNGQK